MAARKASLSSMETLKPCLPCGTAGMEVYTRELAPIHCIFEITGFSTEGSEARETYRSEIFEAGGYKWSLCLYPNGDKKRGGEGHISLYLNIEETDNFSSGWEVLVNYRLFVYDQNNDCYLTIQDVQGAVKRFHERKKQWGFAQLISLQNLRNCSNGYLVDDTCVFGAEVSVLKATTGKPQSDKNDKEVVICEAMPTTSGTKLTPPGVEICSPSSAHGMACDGGVEVYKRERPPIHFTLKINNFSKLRHNTYWSDLFHSGGFNWSLTVYPNGNKEDGGEGHISLYLKFHVSNDVPNGWEVFVSYKLFVLDQKKGDYLTIQDARAGAVRRFHKNKKEWGFAKLLSLKSFKQSSNGYLVNDTCEFGAEVFVMKPTEKFGFLTSHPQSSPNKFNFRMEKFSTLGRGPYESPYSYYKGHKWAIRVHPKSQGSNYGKGVGVLLVLIGARDLPTGMIVPAKYTLRVLDQLNSKNNQEYTTSYTFANTTTFEADDLFVSSAAFEKPENGLLANDTLVVEAEFPPELW